MQIFFEHAFYQKHIVYDNISEKTPISRKIKYLQNNNTF